jgi:diadenosine tetraphosphate (Ap4A) HIT family hydrolase
MFRLDPAFLRTSVGLFDLDLCAFRLQNDARWPWIVLVPRVAAARELADLTPADRGRLIEEVTAVGVAVRAVGAVLGHSVDKLNVGLLGNVTPQLHAHVVGRRIGDAAWPGPVWGVGEAVAYAPAALERAREAALAAFGR